MSQVTRYFTTETVTVYSPSEAEWAVEMSSTLPHRVKRLQSLAGE